MAPPLWPTSRRRLGSTFRFEPLPRGRGGSREPIPDKRCLRRNRTASKALEGFGPGGIMRKVAALAASVLSVLFAFSELRAADAAKPVTTASAVASGAAPTPASAVAVATTSAAVAVVPEGLTPASEALGEDILKD